DYVLENEKTDLVKGNFCESDGEYSFKTQTDIINENGEIVTETDEAKEYSCSDIEGAKSCVLHSDVEEKCVENPHKERYIKPSEKSGKCVLSLEKTYRVLLCDVVFATSVALLSVTVLLKIFKRLK
ncbi:MAG: hypothetical protein IKA02_01365, partial [Clostridia bacterium]|nr:hypothetical protein [Clostridia bacterium]